MTVIVVTGIQGAGKSAVARALAERLDRSAHLRGDVFRRMIGSHLADLVTAIRSRPLYVVVLAPRADVAQARDRARGKTAYKSGDQSPAELDAAFRRETPRIGLWLDTSAQAVTETVEEILGRFRTEAEVRTPPPARGATGP